MRLVADVQPPATLGHRMDGVRLAQKRLLSRGLPSVGAAVNRGFADALRAYEQLAAAGRLRVRVNEFLSWELLEATAALGLPAGFGGSLLRSGTMLYFVGFGAVCFATLIGLEIRRAHPGR